MSIPRWGVWKSENHKELGVLLTNQISANREIKFRIECPFRPKYLPLDPVFKYAQSFSVLSEYGNCQFMNLWQYI